jgi:hypothetical protein
MPIVGLPKPAAPRPWLALALGRRIGSLGLAAAGPRATGNAPRPTGAGHERRCGGRFPGHERDRSAVAPVVAGSRNRRPWRSGPIRLAGAELAPRWARAAPEQAEEWVFASLGVGVPWPYANPHQAVICGCLCGLRRLSDEGANRVDRRAQTGVDGGSGASGPTDPLGRAGCALGHYGES